MKINYKCVVVVGQRSKGRSTILTKQNRKRYNLKYLAILLKRFLNIFFNSLSVTSFSATIEKRSEKLWEKLNINERVFDIRQIPRSRFAIRGHRY